MRQFAILILSLLSFFGFGQSRTLTDDQVNASGANKMVFVDSASQAINLAKTDIAKNVPFLLLQGGDSPIVYSNDDIFQRDFKVFFHDFGCIGPDQKLAVEYNRVIFQHLIKTYGNKWLKRIRKDVIGLKEFKRSRS